jgi:iron complex transport system substrate-binding protein
VKFKFLLFSLIFLLLGCKKINERSEPSKAIEVVDVLGRKVMIHSGSDSIITMRSGAVRLMAYMQLVDKIGYVEYNDLKRTVGYMMAYPELKLLPVIGAGNNYDPEVVAISNSDIIISTNIENEEAEALSQKVGKPVIGIKNGDLLQYKDDFYNSLRVLGQIFKKDSRADSIISFVESNLKDIAIRIDNVDKIKPTAYIGGIAYNGIKGLNSTKVQYAPFVHTKINSPVDSLQMNDDGFGIAQKNFQIDIEQILLWNTDYLFLDIAGQPMWSAELRKPIFKSLKALQNKQVFTVLPYNWNAINHENVLCNMWFIAKTVYPEQFKDINLDIKSKEIINFFYGKDIYQKVMNTKSYSNDTLSNENIRLFKPFEQVVIYD